MSKELFIGSKHGKLELIRFLERVKGHKQRAVFKCSCGGFKEANCVDVKRGSTNSCGCLRSTAQIKHGHAANGKETKTYNVWSSMKKRCLDNTHEQYKNYGGRGITVCKEWLESFDNFLKDMGEKPDGLSLDRIDNNGGYSKDNCRWATQDEQNRNRRTNVLDFDTACVVKTLMPFVGLTEISNLLGIHRSTINHIRKGRRWKDATPLPI